MSKRTIEAIYPLSPMQQGMLFHSLNSPESGIYVEQLSCTFRGNLNVAAFERAWRQATERHPVLRTAFSWQSLDKMLQVVHRQVSLPFETQDWRQLSPAEQTEQLEAFLDADRNRGFEFSRTPLMRLALLRTADDRYEFVWSHHHTLLDGWSMPLLLQEVFALYTASVRGQDIQLAPARPYRDYIAWLQQQDLAAAEAFWRRELAGFMLPTPLPTGLPTDSFAYQPSAYDERLRYLPAEQTEALQSLARQHQLTLNTLVQAAWALLLSRYSGEDDVLYGTTVSGRPADLPGVETMIGLFINTLPVRVQVAPDTPMLTWLQELHKRLAEQRLYEYSPLVQIQGWSNVPRGMPLFESLLVFENYPKGEALQWQQSGLEIEQIRSSDRTNYPLTLTVWPGQELGISISYDSLRFAGDAMERVLDHLCRILEQIASAPRQRLAEVSLLTTAEREQLLVTWNATTADYPSGERIHDLIERGVAGSPDRVAARYAGAALTYADLNRHANQLAHLLQQHGVGPDTLVALSFDRSLYLLVAILAVWKAGGAYLPLDLTHPTGRLRAMLADARPTVLLTHATSTPLPWTDLQPGMPVIDLSQAEADLAGKPPTSPPCAATADHLAYVIYTSGSTGQPKGVLVTHRNLVNAAYAWADAYQLPAMPHRHLQMANVTFDVFVGDLVRALCWGGTLVLCPRDALLIPADLAALIRQEQITCAEFVPAVLRSLLEYLEDRGEQLTNMRVLICGSDTWYAEEFARCRQICPRQTRLINSFGLTETTIDSTFFEQCEPLPLTEGVVPIGRPFANTRIYLVDKQGQPVPIGVPGEVWIGGAGVARGYLHRAELTAAKFSSDPFTTTPGARVYKTGDRARYRADGTIVFLGRQDSQVKIRGHRIETGEIEAVLGQHPAVREAVVLAHEEQPGVRNLVAYVVLTEASTISGDELRAWLRDKLPEYMLPAFFMLLEALPLTPNGKIDRRALPAPDSSHLFNQDSYVAPRTPVEEILAGIWSRVLGINRIGVEDNFFDLGGHSLLATQVISRVREAFQVDLPLRSLFEALSISSLAVRVEALREANIGTSGQPIQPVSRDQDLLLSFAQQRLWFLDQLEPENALYNSPTTLRMLGDLDIPALERSINSVVQRHEILRTVFRSNDGRPYQIILPDLHIPLQVIDLRHVHARQREAEVLRLINEDTIVPFDLAHGPLLRITLLALDDSEHLALMTMHHIISDGWSMNVLIHEIVALYTAFTTGQVPALPELAIQYADFAHWQREWLQGEELATQLGYWKDQLQAAPALLKLPTDRPRPPIQTFNGTSQSFVLPKELSSALKALSQQEGVTLFMTLLAAFQTLLYRYSGEQDICIGTPIANRNRVELESLIGFLINTMVLRTDLSGAPGFRELLKRVRKVTLDAYAHQDVPFEMLVEALQPERNLSHSPLFQVMFSLDVPSEKIELPGLNIEPVQTSSQTASFDLTLVLFEGQDGLLGSIEYNTDLFDDATISRMLEHFQVLLEGIVANPTRSIATLPLLSDAEYQRLVVAWNQTATPYPADQCVQHLFAAQAQRTPTAVAVACAGQHLTYHDLDARANQLAHVLQQHGVGPDTLVGIALGRSLDLLVALLGVLKAGGAYVPLDPGYPAERLAFLLDDAHIALVLTHESLRAHLPATSATILALDSAWPTIARQPATPPPSAVQPDHLAYVIYTSGSTGQPKGVMIAHRGLTNYLTWACQAYPVTAGHGSLVHSSISFDLTVTGLFLPLLVGRTVTLLPDSADITTLADALCQGPAYSLVKLTPAHLEVLRQQIPPDVAAGRTHAFIIGGEALLGEQVAYWQTHAPQTRLVNEYGPTETVVGCCVYLVDPQEEYSGAVPIGRPIANTRLYILDAQRQPVPIGVVGDLYIGGDGVARGYWNRPELTVERFIADPFSSAAGARLYQTGDRVRYRADGQIEFLGRSDDQVKIRGFRIEPGEIEAVLLEQPGVVAAAVVARTDTPGDTRLVAYVVPAAGSTLAASGLQQGLQQRLPAYMLPATYVILDALPLTPNGKVNRRALPAPDGARPDLDKQYVAPDTPTQQTLADLCAELLNLEQVGIYDNFFDLGGHSLLATQFIARVRDRFHIDLPLRTVFEHPSIIELAAQIDGICANQTVEMNRITQLLESIGQLSEAEAEALLREKHGVEAG